MRIAVGNDHRGLPLKLELLPLLKAAGHEVVDLGAGVETSVDYPDFGSEVARRVSRGEADRGILICGTGIGMAITANKAPGVRASIVPDAATVAVSRKHNNLNVLCLGEKQAPDAAAIVQAFLETEFEGGRHADRVAKITAFERG